MTLSEIPTAYAIEDEEIGTSVQTTEEISYNVKQCYSLSLTVKWLAWLDVIFSMLYAFGNIYFFIPLLMALTGVIGAKKFDKNYILCYFTYILLINILRFYLFLEFYLELTPDNRGTYSVYFILVILCVFIEFWIARIIYRFYNVMKALSDDDIIFLRLLNSMTDYNVILW